jgi:hypothetical protein
MAASVQEAVTSELRAVEEMGRGGGQDMYINLHLEFLEKKSKLETRKYTAAFTTVTMQ